MRRIGLVLFLVLGAALAPASASAASSWLAPTELSAPTSNSHYPEVAMNARGDAVAVWVVSEGGGVEKAVGSRRPAGGSWSAPVQLSANGARAGVPQAVIDEAGTATAVWLQSEGLVSRLVSATSPPGSAGWGSPVDVSATGDHPTQFSLAVDRAGEAIVAYEESEGSTYRARVTARPPGGSWAVPATVSAPGENASGPTVAIGDGGDAAIVWYLADGVRAVERPAGGSWTGPVYVVTGEAFYLPSVAVAPDGEAVAVWRKSINGKGAVVESAAEVAGAWSSPVELGGGFFYSQAPQVAIDAAGEAVALWDRSEPSPFRVLAASRPRGGNWSTPVEFPDIDSEGSYAPRLAISAAGQAVATWLSGEAANAIVRAAVKPVGMGWGTPTDLTLPGELGDDPSVAADARGDAVAIWQLFAAPAKIVAAGYDGAGPELRALSIPASATAGAPAPFGVEAVDVWSGVSAIEWGFGDRLGTFGASVSHTYAAPGRYPVGVTAVDGLGNSTSASGAVNVGPAPVAPAKAKGVAHGARVALVRKGKASLALTCGTARCTGVAELLAPPPPSRHAKASAKHRRRPVLAGKSSFDLAPAAHATVSIKLRAAVLRRLRNAPNHQFKVRLQGQGVTAGPVTLREAPRHKHG